MSGVVKGVKKVFKKVGQVIKKIWKPLVIAAAVYFTAGAALGALGAGGAAAGAAGGASAASAASVVSGAATAMGATAAGAGATLGSVAASSLGGFMAAGASTVAGALAAAPAKGIFSKTALSMALGKPGVAAATKAAVGSGVTNAAAAGSGGVMSSLGSMVGNMSGIEKLMWTQTLISGVSGLMTPKPPTPDEQAEASARFRGSYFGVNEKGEQEFDAAAAYQQQMGPRPGQSYSGLVPDDEPTAAAGPATPATPPAPMQQPLGADRMSQSQSQQNRQTNFLDPDADNGPQFGPYSPNDFYG